MEKMKEPEPNPAAMEEAMRRIDGMLLPLFPDLDDSGIDSDSTELMASSARRLNARNGVEVTDGSSSDEEPVVRPWWQERLKQKEDDFLQALEDGRINPLEVNWPMGHRMPEYHRSYAEVMGLQQQERASPPLYEVELTASEEDDDASVLELVIPMQSSRYKRVPTASPKKTKPKPKPKVPRTFYYSFICCLRK